MRMQSVKCVLCAGSSSEWVPVTCYLSLVGAVSEIIVLWCDAVDGGGSNVCRTWCDSL